MRFLSGETLQKAIATLHSQAAAESPDSTFWINALRPLLDRFLVVCDAIAFAHSRGVIHRDLKPLNILVGSYGETHLIDWGIAKAVGREDLNLTDPADGPQPYITPRSGTNVDPTVAGDIFGSLKYMSPEQAAGETHLIDHRTDVYGLGANLYEILTGSPPVDAPNRTEILAKVRAGDIVPPRKRNPRIPAPLESICQKALSLKPSDRYQQASHLADDLKAWLADQPVSVHPDSLGTRLLRWARHNKLPVAAAAAVLLTTLVALSASTWVVGLQRDKARQAQAAEKDQRLLAQQHLRVGLDLVDQLVTLGDRQIATPRNAGTARLRLLETAQKFLRQFQANEPDLPNIDAELAQVARRLAHLHTVIGQFRNAEPPLRDAIARNQELVRSHPADPERGDHLCEAQLDLVDLLTTLGRCEEALPLAETALNAAQSRLSAHPDDARFQRTLARAHVRRGQILLNLAQLEPALETSRAGVSLFQSLALPTRDSLDAELARENLPALTDQLELTNAMVLQANAHAQAAQFDQAETLLRAALDHVDACLRFFPEGNIDFEYFSAWVSTLLAEQLMRQPATRPEADLYLRSAVDNLSRLVDLHPDYLHFQTGLAEALSTRARLRLLSGRLAPARADATPAAEQFQTLHANHPDIPDLASSLALTLETLARIAHAQNPPDSPRAPLNRAITLQQLALKPNPANPLYKKRLESHRILLDQLSAPPDPRSETPRHAPLSGMTGRSYRSSLPTPPHAIMMGEGGVGKSPDTTGGDTTGPPVLGAGVIGPGFASSLLGVTVITPDIIPEGASRTSRPAPLIPGTNRREARRTP